MVDERDSTPPREWSFSDHPAVGVDPTSRSPHAAAAVSERCASSPQRKSQREQCEWRLSREDSEMLVNMSREVSETLLAESVERFRDVVDQELARHLGNMGLWSVFESQQLLESSERGSPVRRSRNRRPSHGRDGTPSEGGSPAKRIATQSFAEVELKDNGGGRGHREDYSPPKTVLGTVPHTPSPSKTEEPASPDLLRINTMHKKLKDWSRVIDDHEAELKENQEESESWVKTKDIQLMAWMDHVQQVKEHHCRGLCALLPKKIHMPPQTALVRFVDGTLFNLVCCLCVCLNAIWMGFETDRGFHNILAGKPRPDWYMLVEVVFIAVFLTELSVRVVALRWYFALGEEALWNLFDASLVLVSFLHVILSSYVQMNVTFVMALRMFRIVRAMRVFRVVRFFHELRYMVVSIIASGVSMLWSFALIMLVIYVFSIFFMQCAISHQTSAASLASEDLVKNYGSIWTTMWSLLEAISGGRDWADIAQPMWELHWTYAVVFLFYILFMVIGVLNVLVGVFVAAAENSFDKDLEIQSEVMRKNQFVKEMCTLFKEFADQDSLGKVSWAHFRAHLELEEVQAYLSLHQLDTSDAFMLFRLLDRDQSKEVDVSEFIQGCLHLKGHARCSDVAFILEETERTKRMMIGFQRQMQMHIHLILAAVERKSFEQKGLSHSQSHPTRQTSFFQEI